ncbi:MAG: DUF202 domain-containing protein [Rhodococcus sp.]|nr:DUF202 domain-containing protein [Rhodococcus sp. (in: high G+C Gram-positive bacteria)]
MPEKQSQPAIPPEPDYRFTLANERTFLAWQRTALGLLATSVAVLHFVPVPDHPVFAYVLGAALAVLAIACATGGLLRWRRGDQAIRDNAPLPGSTLMATLAIVLVAIGAATIALTLIVAG